MLSWLSSLLEIFKNPDGKPDWPRVGAVLAAVMAGAWAVFVFFFEHKISHEQGPSPEHLRDRLDRRPDRLLRARPRRWVFLQQKFDQIEAFAAVGHEHTQRSKLRIDTRK